MLELTGDHLIRLSDENLRTLVSKLCEAELSRAGLPLAVLLDGGNQTARDGGIDVCVQLDNLDVVLDFIPRASTGFQVKCEDMPAGEILKEMRPKGVLRASIKDLIARGGAYVIVSSKGTVTAAFLADRLAAMRDAVADEPNAASLRLEFYDRTRLARWVRQYQGVAMWVRDRINERLMGWEGYGNWARSPVESAYQRDESRRLVERQGSGTPIEHPIEDGIDQLRQALRRPGKVVRLIGLSGTGKTRLAQALFEAEIGNAEPLDTALAIYADLGLDALEPSAREMLLRLGGSEERSIVIVDNCNPTTHANLAEAVHRHPKKLSLLTIEYDVVDDDDPEGTEVFELMPASDQVLDGILEHLAPHLSRSDRHRITDFSGGNARIALALARTIPRGTSLGTLNDAELFRRLFVQRQSDSDDVLRAAEVVSLVYSFEGEDVDSESAEMKSLSGLMGCSSDELYRHVAVLKRRDLIQSRGRWRALLPPALANRLAKMALEKLPRRRVDDALGASSRLRLSFSRRLGYLHDSAQAREIARGWLKDVGFSDLSSISSDDRKLLLNIAPVVPYETLDAIDRALSDDTVHRFVKQRAMKDWSTLLRNLGYAAQDFDRVAQMMLRIAEFSEPDGVREWREMFHILFSGTEATPEQRTQLLERLLATSSGRRFEIIVEAVLAMLETQNFSGSHSSAFGARPQGYGWQPHGKDDVDRWFACAFRLVRSIAESGPDGMSMVRSELALQLRILWDSCNHEQLLTLINDVRGDGEWPEAWLAVKSALRYAANFDEDAKSRHDISRLRGLEASLAPKELLAEIRAYAFSHANGRMDASYSLDDPGEDDDGNDISAYERLEQKVIDLGRALAARDDVLSAVLPELLDKLEGRRRNVGYGLGLATEHALRHWQMIQQAFVQSTGKRNVDVLSGFLQGLRQNRPDLADEIVDGLAGDPLLEPYFALLAGITRSDADLDRLIQAMQRGYAKAHHFQLKLATHGQMGLSAAIFCKAVGALAEMEDGLNAALNLLASEVTRAQARSEELEASPELARLARTLLCRFSFDLEHANMIWRLDQLAKLAFEGEDAAPSARVFCRRFANAIANYKSRTDEYEDLACTLLSKQPRSALDAFFGEPGKQPQPTLRSRFSGQRKWVVEFALEGEILAWVRKDPEIRAPLIALEIEVISREANCQDTGAAPSGDVQLVRPVMSHLAVKLLSTVSDRQPVLAAYAKTLHPGTWVGSLANSLVRPFEFLSGLVDGADPELADWARACMTELQNRIDIDRRLQTQSEQSFE